MSEDHFPNHYESATLLSQLDALPSPYQFDVTNYATISNPDLIKHIDTVGVLLKSLKQ
jgi:hypothetical protein